MDQFSMTRRPHYSQQPENDGREEFKMRQRSSHRSSRDSRIISDENHGHDAIIIPVETETRSSNDAGQPKLSRPVSRSPNFVSEETPDDDDIDAVIIREAKKMVLFDNISEEVIKNAIKSQRISQVQNEKTILTLKELRKSSMPLGKKVDLAEDQMRDLKRQNSSANNGDFKLMEKTKSSYESTMERVDLNFWNKHIWIIQGKFGSTTAKFFDFMFQVTILDLVFATMILGLVFVPQVTLPENSNNSTVPENCTAKKYSNVSFYPSFQNYSDTTCCSREYEKILIKAKERPTDRNFSSLAQYYAGSIVQGDKFMESTPLFYGAYNGTFIFIYDNITFDFPLAYFLVILSIFFISLAWLVITSRKSIKGYILNKIEIEDGDWTIFPIVFGGWDHKISHKESVAIQHSDLAGRLKSANKIVSRRRERVNEEKSKIRKRLAIRILAHIFWATSVGGCVTAVYFANIKQSDLVADNGCISTSFEDLVDADNLKQTAICTFYVYLQPIVLTVINIMFPFIYSLMIEFEDYEENTKLILNIARIFALRMVSLVFLIFTIYSQVSCDYVEGCFDDKFDDDKFDDKCGLDATRYRSCTNIGLPENKTEFYFKNYCRKPICWETYVGQQFYILTWVDLIAQVLLTFLFDGPRTWLIGHCLKGKESIKSFRNMFGVIEFNVTKHLLDIVYSQTICWLSLFYAPLITVVTAIKLIFVYLLRIFYVNVICSPASVPYTASQATNFFKYTLLVALVLSTGVIGLFIAEVNPSTSCGPFRGEGGSNEIVFNYITRKVKELDNLDGLKQFLYVISNEYFLIVACLVMLILIYFTFAVSRADTSLAKELKIECTYELNENKTKVYDLQKQLTYFRGLLKDILLETQQRKEKQVTMKKKDHIHGSSMHPESNTYISTTYKIVGDHMSPKPN